MFDHNKKDNTADEDDDNYDDGDYNDNDDDDDVDFWYGAQNPNAERPRSAFAALARGASRAQVSAAYINDQSDKAYEPRPRAGPTPSARLRRRRRRSETLDWARPVVHRARARVHAYIHSYGHAYIQSGRVGPPLFHMRYRSPTIMVMMMVMMKMMIMMIM